MALREGAVMEGPSFEPHFVTTEAYEKVDNIVTNDNAPVLVIHGERSGVGKTAIASEACAKLDSSEQELPNSRRVMYRVFNCGSIDSLHSDMKHFYKQLEIPPIVQTGSWEIIQQLYNDMNTHFVNHLKLFIFDGAKVEEVLKAFNNLCKKIKMKEDKRNWKIFVTLQVKVQWASKYACIGEANFVYVEGFNVKQTKELFRHSKIPKDRVEQIRKALGPSVLALKICLRNLESNFIDEPTEYIDNLLVNIEREARVLMQRGHVGREHSPLIAIKLSVEDVVKELRFADESLKVIKMITFFQAENISGDLLTACAETCHSDPHTAKEVIKNLTSRLVQQGICKAIRESHTPFFRHNELVKESLKLLVQEPEEKSLITKALIALTRVMSKDGRKHQDRFVGFYMDHGKSVIAAIKELGLRVNQCDTPFIQLLHCDLLMALGYGQWRLGDSDGEEERLKEARNKYCELILASDYQELVHRKGGNEKEAAKELYQKGKGIELLSHPEYKKYAKEMPNYLHLTQKDLVKMQCGIKVGELVNGHFSKDHFRGFASRSQVVDGEKHAKIYVAEILVQILWMWARRVELESADRIAHLETAVEICEEIFNDHKIYLLIAVIIKREFLKNQLEQARTPQSVAAICDQFEALSNVGNVHQFAYEAGLMKSDLQQDGYNKILCIESVINAQGRLHGFATTDGEKEDLYNRGEVYFREVKRLAGQEVAAQSTLSFCLKNFAQFLSDCGKNREAVLRIILAMQALHRHTYQAYNADRAARREHPELNDRHFIDLCEKAEGYFKKFSDQRGERTDDSKLFDPTMDEYKYLRSAMDYWSNQVAVSNQPSDANTKYSFLENLLDDEVQPLY